MIVTKKPTSSYKENCNITINREHNNKKVDKQSAGIDDCPCFSTFYYYYNDKKIKFSNKE